MRVTIMIPPLSNNKVAVFSDLHLGVHSNSAQWHEIALNWARWFKQSLIENDIEDVIFCGDWHHNRSEISVDTLNVSAEILSLLEDFKLYLVVGNHDVYYKHRTDVHSLNIFKNRKNVFIIDTPTVLSTKNRVINFMPWGTTLDQLPPKADICFGHLEIESFKMNSAKECEEGMKVSDLLKHFKLVMSGHFHLRHERKFATGTVMYTGNPFQMDFGDEQNDKGYYLLDIDTLNYEFVENTVSPKHHKITLSEMVSAGAITSEIQTKFSKNFTKLSIDKNICLDHINILLAKLNSFNPASIIVSYDTAYNKILTNTLDRDFSGIDINQAIEEFIELLDIENKQKVIEYTLELYKKCSYK